MLTQKKLKKDYYKNHNKSWFYFDPAETARLWQTPASWWGMPESIIFGIRQRKGEMKKEIEVD